MSDKTECFMLTKKGTCNGMIRQSICGPDCPFRKTFDEQLAIEKKIVRRFEEIGYIGTYRSRLTKAILYKSDGRSTEVYI